MGRLLFHTFSLQQTTWKEHMLRLKTAHAVFLWNAEKKAHLFRDYIMLRINAHAFMCYFKKKSCNSMAENAKLIEATKQCMFSSQ